MNPPDFAAARRCMVQRQIAARGVTDPLVLQAMQTVPREWFVPEELRGFAYDDSPLPIGQGQTISQPYIVAFMIEALHLQKGDKVLEIGAGSGYAAAVLATIAGDIYSIERIESLADTARDRLAHAGYPQVRVICGDGTRGWPEAAPFDAIVVAAGGPEVPESLKQQLKIGGRLVIPAGSRPDRQQLLQVTRVSKTDFVTKKLAPVRFVPLIGEEGWDVTTS
jgi:protein-L-isoaspartate(D-aspartate) O-methyltransferase